MKNLSDIGDALNFTGDGGLTTDSFKQGVLRWALQEKIYDLESPAIPIFAASCMMGAAQAWYTNLPNDVRISWPRLSDALQNRWSEARLDEHTDPEEADPSSFPPKMASRSIERGRIRVIGDKNEQLGWIHSRLAQEGEFFLTRYERNALRVWFDPSIPRRLGIEGSATQRLGMAWSLAATPLEKVKPMKVSKGQVTKLLQAKTVIVGALCNTTSTWSSPTWTGIFPQGHIWDMLRDNTLAPRWNGANGQRFDLAVFATIGGPGDRSLNITNNYDYWASNNDPETFDTDSEEAKAETSSPRFCKVRLEFEPI